MTTKLVRAENANPGDMVDPNTLPFNVVREKGGWVGSKYYCLGCHKDGSYGWQCIQAR